VYGRIRLEEDGDWRIGTRWFSRRQCYSNEWLGDWRVSSFYDERTDDYGVAMIETPREVLYFKFERGVWYSFAKRSRRCGFLERLRAWFFGR
jgi:hypothetical protein